MGIGIFLRGLAMGVCDAIPGISGSTIALITGVYERLISQIESLSNLSMHIREKSLGAIQWGFLILLGAGILIGVLGTARLLDWALEVYPSGTYTAFFGLLVSSTILLFRQKRTHIRYAWLLPGIAFGLLIGILVPAQPQEYTLLLALVGGAAAIAAMLLPGISGSYVLLLMGLYQPTIRLISSPLENVSLLACFILGMGVSALLVVRLVKKAFTLHHDLTLSVLIGLVIGSLIAPARYAIASPSILWVQVAVLLAGLFIPWIILLIAQRLQRG